MGVAVARSSSVNGQQDGTRSLNSARRSRFDRRHRPCDGQRERHEPLWQRAPSIGVPNGLRQALRQMAPTQMAPALPSCQQATTVRLWSPICAPPMNLDHPYPPRDRSLTAARGCPRSGNLGPCSENRVVPSTESTGKSGESRERRIAALGVLAVSDAPRVWDDAVRRSLDKAIQGRAAVIAPRGSGHNEGLAGSNRDGVQASCADW